MAARMLLITLFAALIALGSTQEWEEPMVETGVAESLLQESAFPTDAAAAADTHMMNGGDVPAHYEAVAHLPPSDKSMPITCAEGEVACDGGMCVAAGSACPEGTLVGTNEPTGAYQYTFNPDPNTLSKPPAVAGRESDYESMAKDYQNSQTAAAEEAVVHAEQSAGAAFAAHDFELDSKAQRLDSEKQEVRKEMNIAAADAAAFKKADALHDKAVLAVKTARAAELAQEKVVEEAKETLKQEEKRLKEAKMAVSKAVHAEQQARYNAEFKGNTYEHDKAKAIRSDNALQEEIHEADEKEKFRQVAIKAVRQAAAAELAKTKAKPLAEHKKAFHEKAAQDCPEGKLPAIYVQAGGKCEDCPKWAKKGECTQAEYSKFMAHYCAGSCAKIAAAPATPPAAEPAAKPAAPAAKPAAPAAAAPAAAAPAKKL